MAKRVRKFGGGRTRLLEELGRVEAEPSNRNRRAEISRVHGELNKGYAKGGKAGTGPSPGTRIKARKAKAHEWWTGHTGTQGIYSPTIDKKLREKRPHSSPEGRMRDVKKIMADAGERRKTRPKIPKHGWKSTPTFKRAKKGIGGVIKKGISQLLKPKGVFKPKPVPKAVTDVDKPFKGYDKSYTRADDKKMDALLKKVGDEIKAQPLPPKLKETMKKLQKAYGPHKRVKKGHGGSAAQQHYLQHGYGPTKAKLRSGKPKIAKKGWA